MDQSSPPAVSPFCGRSKVGDAGLYLLPERARQPQLATSLVAPAAAVRVDVRRRRLLAAPAGIFRCARCRLAAASSNYSPILGIAPCLSRLFCHAAIVGLSLLPNPPANYQPLSYLVSHAGL